VTYSIFILPRAQREIASLDAPERARIKAAIEALCENPRPTGCTKLAGRNGWRIRVGNYRAIYEIDDAARSVVILHVGHRRDVYSR
jgi:mRNA interferase RelE/StbE